MNQSVLSLESIRQLIPIDRLAAEGIPSTDSPPSDIGLDDDDELGLIDEEDDVLELSDEVEEPGGELLLDSDDILTSPVGAPPIAPPMDEDESAAAADEARDEAPEPKPAASGGGTLFERMSSIARGAAKAQLDEEEPAPGFRREPIDIPRFLNRQNNQ